MKTKNIYKMKQFIKKINNVAKSTLFLIYLIEIQIANELSK